jgi:alpha-1,3-mannosyltransferase
MHSIYLLRLFNDCFATLFASLAVLILCSCGRTNNNLFKLPKVALSSILLSAAISVKMSALLYLPGAAIIFLAILGSVRLCILIAGIPMILVQVLVAWPFVSGTKSDSMAYLNRAFEFKRQFLYKWTVNWKFVPEDQFLSKQFAISLLALHLSLILYFCSLPGKRWLGAFESSSLPSFIGSAFFRTASLRTLSDLEWTRHVVRTVWLSNIIGILSARSLHYQFYSWFYWTVPFLLLPTSSSSTSSKKVMVIRGILLVGIWLVQELAWLVYPGTPMSSALVISSLLVTVLLNL